MKHLKATSKMMPVKAMMTQNDLKAILDQVKALIFGS